MHVAIYLLRALRFRALLRPAARPGIGPVLAVSAAHNLAAYVLPAKTGEASFVLYLRGSCGVPAAEGLASLLVSRLLDLATLGGMIALSCLALSFGGRAEDLPWLRPLGGVLLFVALAFGGLCLRPAALARAFLLALRALGLARTRLGARLAARGEQVATALRAAGADGRLAQGVLLSVALWLCVFAFYALLARGFGLAGAVGFVEAVFGAGLSTVANLLPINGFAGFGTQEAGWVVGFGLLGVPRDLALSTGVAAHLVQLVNVALMGLLGHLAMGLGGAAARRS